MLNKNYFITGTNTNVGKTYVTVQLLKYFRSLGFSALGLKPIASGGNEDIVLLQQASSYKLSDKLINNILFQEPIAPHLAAELHGVKLTAHDLAEYCVKIINTHKADYCFIEGAGGWLVPLNQQETMADLAKLLGFPVIMVVSIELGCINHALLTCQSIEFSGLSMAGWIANCKQSEMLAVEENIASLKQRIAAPLITVINNNSAINQNFILC